MSGKIEYNDYSKLLLKSLKIFIISLVLVLFLIYSKYFYLDSFKIAALFFCVILASFIFNSRVIYYFFVVSIFIGWVGYFFHFAISEYFAILVLISFLITQRFELREIKNPVLPYFLVFIATILPSYLNSGDISISMILSYRLFAFFFIFTITSIIVSKYSLIESIFKVFVFLAIMNGIQVIYLALTTGKRVFGFAGIMFVDLVSIALIICIIGFIYYRNKRIRYAIGTFILTCALIFTQTRGIWIVAGITIVSIMIHSCFNYEKAGIKRRRMVYTVILSFLFIIAIVLLLQNLNPGTYERVNLPSKSPESVNFSNINSLATRYFIWLTAWNAFTTHPFIGIGFYSFPYTSANYSTISPLVYEMFVKNLTAHTTILALLAEVGLLGFVGFLIFLLNTLKFAKKNLDTKKSDTQWYNSLIIFWVAVYISLSMIITDAWLWGTLLMVWGMILGLSIANYKLIHRD